MTRFTFDGREYGVVNKELEVGDYVVIPDDYGFFLRKVEKKFINCFYVNEPIDGKKVCEYDDYYKIVEPLDNIFNDMELNEKQCFQKNLLKKPKNLKASFWFNTNRYTSVDKELEKDDLVVFSFDFEYHLRKVVAVYDEVFTVDAFVNTKNALKDHFECEKETYYIVEPSWSSIYKPSKSIKMGLFGSVNTTIFSDFIEDEANAFKNFLLDKNDRYGDSVLKTYEKYGQVAFDVRIEDKKNRLEHLLENGHDITDTIKDIHGYMMLNEAVKKMKKDEV